MNLRAYQSAASDAIFAEWQEHDATLVVMPTGGGKTVLFADVIRRVFPRRALVLAHREELIFQARGKRRWEVLECAAMSNLLPGLSRFGQERPVSACAPWPAQEERHSTDIATVGCLPLRQNG